MPHDTIPPDEAALVTRDLEELDLLIPDAAMEANEAPDIAGDDADRDEVHDDLLAW